MNKKRPRTHTHEKGSVHLIRYMYRMCSYSLIRCYYITHICVYDYK